ncbi:hypothetical protein ACFL5S_00070 [Fibrobacterota bacterium]
MRFIFLFTIIVAMCSMAALGETDTVMSKSDSKATKKSEVTKKTVPEKKAETEKPAKERKTAEAKKTVEEKEVEKKKKAVKEKKADKNVTKEPAKPAKEPEAKRGKNT